MTQNKVTMFDASTRLSIGGDRARLLRFALKLDAAATGTLGVVALVAGPTIADLLGIPLLVLRPGGLILVAYAAAVWIGASRPAISRAAAWQVIAVNLLWVVGSIVVVVAGWFPLTALGTGFLLAQAVAVDLFADLQFLGLRRGLRGNLGAGPEERGSVGVGGIERLDGQLG